MKKVKRYQDGGFTVSSSPMSAFQQTYGGGSTGMGGGVGNNAPLVEVNTTGNPPAPAPNLFGTPPEPLRKGGKVKAKAKKYASGGKVSGYRKAADGCATKGKTRGKMV